MRHIYYFLFLVFCYCHTSQAKEEGMFAIIEVEILDSNAVDVTGELQLHLGEYFSFRYPIRVSNRTETRKVNNKDLLAFRLPLTEHTNFMEVKYMSPNQGGSLKYSGFFLKQQPFLIQDGDSLRIKITGDSLNVSGRGSDRLNLQLGIGRIASNARYNGADTGGADADIEKFIDVRSKVAAEQLKFLKKHKNSISPKTYDLMYFDIIGFRNLTIVSKINSMIVGNPDIGKERDRLNIEAYHLLTDGYLNYHEPYTDEWHMSPYFMDYLFFREVLLMKVTKLIDLVPAKRMMNGHELFQRLSEKFTGSIKERLLLMGAAYLIGNEIESDDYLYSASEYITTQPYRHLVLSLSSNRRVGKAAYNFSLPDSSGNLVRLTDFRGKAVVIDFWFTGCIPCRNLKEMMEPIVQSYDKDEVVFVTISIDKSADVWKEQGIKSGLYTHKGGVDLFTNGQGWNTSVVKYYNLTGLPSLLIIDKKGKLVSASPPRPNSNENTDKLKLLIDLAIGNGE